MNRLFFSLTVLLITGILCDSVKAQLVESEGTLRISSFTPRLEMWDNLSTENRLEFSIYENNNDIFLNAELGDLVFFSDAAEMTFNQQGDLSISGQLKGKTTIWYNEFINRNTAHGDADYDYDNDWVTANNVIGATDDLNLMAVIDIPFNATITKVHLYYYDNNSGSAIDFSLERRNMVTLALVDDFSLTSAGASFASTSMQDISITPNFLSGGDNEVLTIVARANDSNNIGIRAVIIEYE